MQFSKRWNPFKVQHILLRHPNQDYPLLFISTWSYNVFPDMSLPLLLKLGQRILKKIKTHKNVKSPLHLLENKMSIINLATNFKSNT